MKWLVVDFALKLFTEKKSKITTSSKGVTRKGRKRRLPFKRGNSVIMPSILTCLCLCRMTRELNLPSVMELGKGVLKSLHTAMPAKTAVSPRSSPLVDVSRGVTSATQPQKFHDDDVKSVRNPVINADWTTE